MPCWQQQQIKMVGNLILVGQKERIVCGVSRSMALEEDAWCVLSTLVRHMCQHDYFNGKMKIGMLEERRTKRREKKL